MQDTAHIDLGLLNNRKRAGLLIWTALITLAVSFTGIGIFLLSNHLYGSRTGILAATLWNLIPAPYLFYSDLDVIYPLASSLLLLVFFKTLQARHWSWPIALGCLFSVALFFTYAFIFYIMMFIIILSYKAIKRSINRRHVAWISAWTILPPLAFYLWLYAKYRFNTITTFFAIRAFVASDLAAFRPYHQWIFFNIYEFFSFFRIAAAVLFIFGTYLLIKNRPKGEVLPIIAFLACFLVFNFSGMALGEVGRVWILLMPYPAIIAARTLSGSKSRLIIGLIFMLQLLMIVIQKTNLRLIDI